MAVVPSGCLVGGFAVVGTACRYVDETAFCLPQQVWRLGGVIRMTVGQNMGGDLAGADVHGNVELAPLRAGVPVLRSKGEVSQLHPSQTLR